MKNAIIWGFLFEIAHVIKELKERDKINPVCWIGTDRDSTHSIFDFYFHPEKVLSDFKPEYSGYGHEIYEKVQAKCIYKFIDMFSRHSKNERYKPSFHDYLDTFNIYFDFFAKLFYEKNINLVLFSNHPHEGADVILYTMAKELGIETILLYPVPVLGKIAYVKDLEDFGKFSEIKEISLKKEDEKFQLEWGFGKKKNYFYNDQTEFFRNKNTKEIDKKNKIFKRDHIRLKIGKLFLEFTLRNSYLRRIRSVETEKFSLDEKYVYFPLHLQPELETSGLSGIYGDQALAIERLSKMLPENTWIYVKEHPMQSTDFMRGELFFERLKLLKNVKFLPIETPSSLLIEKSLFVATLTGTAGWEALCGGRNVLVFGRAWYKSLTGVFEYKNRPSFEEICAYEIKQESLEKEINELFSKFGNGICEEDCARQIKDFDLNKNAGQVADLIEALIK